MDWSSDVCSSDLSAEKAKYGWERIRGVEPPPVILLHPDLHMPCEAGVVCQTLGGRQFGGQLDGIEAAVKFVDVELAGVDIAYHQERLDLGDRWLNSAGGDRKRARLNCRPYWAATLPA